MKGALAATVFSSLVMNRKGKAFPWKKMRAPVEGLVERWKATTKATTIRRAMAAPTKTLQTF